MKAKVSIKKNFFWLISCLIFIMRVNGQTVEPPDNSPKIKPASPEASALGKYGDFGVGLFSGTPEFAINLYNIETPHLKVPITLNYSTNGIKVDELASRVGMSWTLQSGGVISRTTYDKPDFGFNSRAPLPPTSDFTLSTVDANILSWMQSVDVNEQDMQMDEFNFSFPGYTGKFFIGLDNQPVLIPYAPLKIEFDFNRTDWNFKITAPDGLKYYFGGNNARESSYSTGCGNSDIDTAPSSWFLIKIEHPYDLSDFVQFIYNPTSCSYSTGVNQTITFADPIQSCGDETDPFHCGSCGPSPFRFGTTGSLANGKAKFCQTSIIIQGVYLTEIRDSKFNKVIFDYISKPDVSAGTDYLVSKITVYNEQTNNVIKSFDLVYFLATPLTSFSNFYLDQGPVPPIYKSRPFLTEVHELDKNNIRVKKHQFTYNDINNLPGRASFAQDYWGYFNGVNNERSFIPKPEFASSLLNDGMVANRNPDYNYASKGLLTTIQYPTGGTTSIEYQGNTNNATYVGPGGTNTGIVEDPTQSITINSSNPAATFRVYENIIVQVNSFVSCNCPTMNGCPPKLDSDIWAQLVKDGVTLNNFTYEAYNLRGECSKASSNTFTLTPGLYGLGFLPSAQAPYLTTITLTVQTSNKYVYKYNGSPVPSTEPLSYTGGGLRVKKISSFEPLTGKTSVRIFEYDGIIFPESPKYTKQFVWQEQFWSPTDPSGCVPWNGLVHANYIQFFSNSLINLFGTGGMPVYYSKVTEFMGNQKENGGIEHNYSFSSPPTFIPLVGSIITSTVVPKLSWKNGLETSTVFFKLNGTIKLPVEKKTFDYTIDNRKSNTLFQYLIERTGDAGGVIEISLRARVFNVCKIPYRSEWQYLSSEKTENFDLSGNPTVTQIKNFFYDNELHGQLTRSEYINSKGELIKELYKYPLDNNISALNSAEAVAVPLLISQGRNNVSIETEQYNNNTLTSRHHNFYNSINNIPLLAQSTVKKGTGSDYVDLVIDEYDLEGRIKTFALSDGVKKSYIYDYRSSLPVAEVTGSSNTDIAHTSFETNGTGNWTFSSNTPASFGITGTKSYVPSTGSISKTDLSVSTEYIVSYWSTSGSCSVSGTIGNPIAGKSVNINGVVWNYYQHQVTGVTSVNVSGNMNIDELRLYPKGAQMTTFTYEPLIGITSMCNATSEISFYEYDGFGRLIRIRDEDKNILKQFEYNYGSCGNNCFVLPMQTFNGTNTISYPVGVFNVNGKLLGNAWDQTEYRRLWNLDNANQAIGTIAAGSDPMRFNLTVNSGATIPTGVIGCRYYQFDLPYTKIDALRRTAAAYVDFGDGNSMSLGKTINDNTGVILPPYTTQHLLGGGAYYYSHDYPDNSLKILTFYHNDEAEYPALDNALVPATSLMLLRNLRGTYPQNAVGIGGSCYQQPSAQSVANIVNWNSITKIKTVHFHNGDNQNPSANLDYAQDFMANNKGLENIYTSYYGPDRTGYRDLTFKISRLKIDWNTYFTQLKDVRINDDHWDRENLSGLKQLKSFKLWATRQNHQDGPSSPFIQIPSLIIDDIINQISSGAGQTVSNGLIVITTGGTVRTDGSNTSVNHLKSKGWTININGVVQ